MSSNGFLLSLDIDRRGCWRVAALVGCATLLALIGVNLGFPAGQPRALAALLVLAGGLWEAWRAWPGHRGNAARVNLSVAGQFSVSRAGEPETLELATVVRWWVLPGLAIGLGFRCQSGRLGQVIVFSDQLPADGWRRLQVRLRHDSAPAAPLTAHRSDQAL
ncbi:MAG: hypothetical protein EXR82_04655 [Gammaproteobacteria bacterium]|nr:hypothetical protein [Gammaproteobacteria bacterium]